MDKRGGCAGVFILDGDDPDSLESPLGDCLGETGNGEMARASDCASITTGDEGRRSSGRIGGGIDGGGAGDEEPNQLRRSGSFLAVGGGASIEPAAAAAVVAADPPA